VKGYTVVFSDHLGRKGRTIFVNSVLRSSPASVRKARESFLGVKGAKIFNLLPASIRNLNSDHVDRFKANLDEYSARYLINILLVGRPGLLSLIVCCTRYQQRWKASSNCYFIVDSFVLKNKEQRITICL
jgi:hypothetical protein